jgi:aspartate racemase
MYSVDFGPIEELMRQGDWQQINKLLVDVALHLHQGGADFIMICFNTIHKCADNIIEQTGMPLIHIADAAAQKVKEQGITKVGLLGTKFVMEGDFYRKRLKEQYEIEVVIPEEAGRDLINTAIFQELCQGIFNKETKEQFQKIINKLLLQGAEGIVLGCTEIPLLIKQTDVTVPVFDTMTLHAAAAVRFALEN